MCQDWVFVNSIPGYLLITRTAHLPAFNIQNEREIKYNHIEAHRFGGLFLPQYNLTNIIAVIFAIFFYSHLFIHIFIYSAGSSSYHVI